MALPWMALPLAGMCNRCHVAAPLRAQTRTDLTSTFAEHALGTVCAGESERLEIYQRGIDAIRAFFTGDATIHQLHDAYVEASRLEPIGRQGVPVKHHEFWSVQYLLFRCCCQREFEAVKLSWRTKYQPDANAVAQAACHAIAHKLRGEDSTADTPEQRQARRARTRLASESEARWQVQRILEYAQMRE
jgi:hypothetical protein